MPSSKRLSPRERLLQCALREFSQYGFFGARVARITLAAKVNPRMLFYYFKSKKGLFNAVQESVWKRADLAGAPPQQPVDDLGAWYQFYCQNPDWARILLWEGLERRKMEPKEGAQRRIIWKTNLEKMANNRGAGRWPESIDLPHLLLSLLAIQLAPIALPHQARMMTGKDPFSPEFIRDRQNFLKDFVAVITRGFPVTRGQAKRKPGIASRKILAAVR
jgi:TetR/AcrR family transcriptional regulator